jgi:hypothetical protein
MLQWHTRHPRQLSTGTSLKRRRCQAGSLPSPPRSGTPSSLPISTLCLELRSKSRFYGVSLRHLYRVARTLHIAAAALVSSNPTIPEINKSYTSHWLKEATRIPLDSLQPALFSTRKSSNHVAFPLASAAVSCHSDRVHRRFTRARTRSRNSLRYGRPDPPLNHLALVNCDPASATDVQVFPDRGGRRGVNHELTFCERKDPSNGSANTLLSC